METAAACLEHGLQADKAAFQLRPVPWLLVTDMVSHHCPHTELLEKLCGRTGQKYFQLLGNTDDGLPEFVLADIHTLVSSRPSPAVAHILSQMQDRSQPQPQQIDPALPPAGQQTQLDSSMSPAQAGKDAVKGKQPSFVGTAGPKQGSSKGVDSSWEDPPPGFAPLSSRGSPPADKPAPAVPPLPTSNASSTDAGGSKAMQALLSACMQLPPANSKDSGTAQVKPAGPPVQQTKAAAGNTANTNGLTAVNDETTLLSSKPQSDVPISTAEAEAPNGDRNGVHHNIGTVSRSSSSASGMTDAIQVRSAASTELSAGSTVSVNTSPAATQHNVQDPFCIECIAQPGRCHRHPLVPASPDGAEDEEGSLEAAAGSSECSSQVCFCNTRVLTQNSVYRFAFAMQSFCPFQEAAD